ncbi:hypothetical protein [Pedobacter paludis]|nr:hypothetical protein [Pedobacter paludis]
MIQELNAEELLATNGGLAKSPKDVGYFVGHWVGKALIVWATFFE